MYRVCVCVWMFERMVCIYRRFCAHVLVYMYGSFMLWIFYPAHDKETSNLHPWRKCKRPPCHKGGYLARLCRAKQYGGVYAAQPFPVISGYGCCRKRTHRDVVRTYNSSATMARSPPYINKTYMPSESLCYMFFIPRWPNAPVQHKNIHVRRLIINYVTHLTMGRGPPYIRKNYTYGNQSLSQSRVIVIQ